MLGGLTTFLGCKLCGRSTYWIYIAPLLTCLIGVFLSFLTKLEALLCVIVAVPIMLVPASIGGALVGLILEKMDGKVQMNIAA